MKTIVCFGDSITEGAPHVHEEDTYPRMLERRLNYRPAQSDRVACINSGVGGENTAEGLARIGPTVLDHKPDVVTVEFGCNDIRYEPEKTLGPDQFAANLRTMYDTISSAGAEVVFMTPSPIVNAFHEYSKGTNYYDRWGGCNGAIIEYAGVVREVAVDLDAHICDIYEAFLDVAIRIEFEGGCFDHEDLTCLAPYIRTDDGVHPTVPGQALIAAELYKLLVRNGLPGDYRA